MPNKFIDDWKADINVETIVNSIEASNEEIDLDRNYNKEIRTHRNRLSRMDHWFEYLLHPICVLSIAVLLFVMFLVFHFIGMYYETKAAESVSNYLWGCFTHIICIFITYFFTEMYKGARKKI
jgi:uncharacterized protein YqhQ